MVELAGCAIFRYAVQLRVAVFKQDWLFVCGVLALPCAGSGFRLDRKYLNTDWGSRRRCDFASSSGSVQCLLDCSDTCSVTTYSLWLIGSCSLQVLCCG